MRSTFMGLETSRRGLFTQQTALYTTGHNISNANTEGYTRQRVNLEPTLPYPGSGLNQPKMPGNIGTGSKEQSVQRIRDEFIDKQYRQETNKFGYWESRTKEIGQMEDILNEPSEYGINEAFNLFWKSLEDVSTSPESASSRRVAISRAEHLAESFNYTDVQLKQIQGNIGYEVKVSTTQINSILEQIAGINNQVQAVEPNGYLPNDLYDARDLLIDQLNEYIPVTIDHVRSGGNALEIAEGAVTVKFNGKELVNGKEYAQVKAISNELATLTEQTPLKEITGDDVTQMFTGLAVSKVGNPPNAEGDFVYSVVKYDDFEVAKGKLLSLVDSYGYQTTDAAGASVTKGYYPEMIAHLDQIVNVFKEVFNSVHRAGFNLYSNSSTVSGEASTDPTIKSGSGLDFFVGSNASGIQVNDAIVKDFNLLAASSAKGEEGNGKWAVELANIQSKSIGATGFKIDLDSTNSSDASVAYDGTTSNLGDATFQSFYQAVIGRLGVDGQKSNVMQTNSETLRLAVLTNRDSMSSVSLDEEMSNMVSFQQAYNANARMLTVVDETLDKIINGMGRAGL